MLLRTNFNWNTEEGVHRGRLGSLSHALYVLGRHKLYVSNLKVFVIVVNQLTLWCRLPMCA